MTEPAPRPIRVLFICQYNRRRSATAERVFARDPDLEVRSAGCSADALVRINERMLDWADVVFVMEDAHARTLAGSFPNHPALGKIVCLDVPDRWAFLHEDLVALLKDRAEPHLARLRARRE